MQRHSLEVNFKTFGAQSLTVSLKGLPVDLNADDVRHVKSLVKDWRNPTRRKQLRPVPENGNAGGGNGPGFRNGESVKPAKPRILKQLKSPKDRGKLRDV